MSAVSSLRSEKIPSTQLRAVLVILNSDPYLKNAVLPFVDQVNESIDWAPVFKMPFGSGHKGALTFAYSVWTDEVKPDSNPFSSALSMSPAIQCACLQALALRWGLTR